jgi:mycofactocin precursor
MTEPTTPAVDVSESEQETEAAPQPGTDAQAGALIEHELLVEDVSIDGMCGVY